LRETQSEVLKYARIQRRVWLCERSRQTATYPHQARPARPAGFFFEETMNFLGKEKQERRALSMKEAAAACGLSRATLYRLLNDGKLTTIKVGARRLVPVGAIDALMRDGA
jgi:excisionase family DNA binding protein